MLLGTDSTLLNRDGLDAARRDAVRGHMTLRGFLRMNVS